MSVVAFAGATARADEVEQEEIVVGEEVVQPAAAPCPECDVNNGMVSFAMGVDITTAYYFRGIVQEKYGFIAQPWGEVTFTLWEAEENSNSFVTDFTGTLGTWNSVQSNKTGSPMDGTGPGNWYESDIYGGFGIGMEHGLGLGVNYIAYTSPNNAFGTVQELDADISWDDSTLYGGEMQNLGFGINPYALFAFELDKNSFPLHDEEGIYVEVGAEPSVELMSDSDYPIGIGVPLTVGLSLSDYYAVSGVSDDTFGFFQAGLSTSVGLGFVPPEYGSLSAGLAGYYIAFGNSVQDYNDAAFTTIGGSDWIGTLSLNWEY
ncbi:MAG: hypothetical protein FJ144_03035 [Deltaproteobacteria bacterium]|nr:hypothetical protein [Deltaproteobacteria bacterium]